MSDVAADAETGGPVVVGANWYRCRPGEKIHYGRVMSLCYIWVRHGSGSITTGGREHRLTTNSLLRLPWGHDVTYRADRSSPFHLGTVHLVPWHSHAVPVEPRVPFRDDDPFLDVWFRGGRPAPTSSLLASGASGAGRAILALSSYAVETFTTSGFGEDVQRPLAELIMAEGRRLGDGETPSALPARLTILIDHIRANLARPISVAEVARVGGCSEATVQRLFRRWTGRSVLSWVQQQKMEEAALLLRTTGYRVGEVAAAVGFEDPLYFSRVFKATFSLAPRAYAADEIRL